MGLRPHVPAASRRARILHSVARTLAALSISIGGALVLPGVARAVLIPPGPPVNVTVTASGVGQTGVTVVVSWDAAADNGNAIASYIVQVASAGSCTANPAKMACSVTGLTRGKTYTVMVMAISVAGPGVPAIVQYTVPDFAGAPTNVAARVTSISGQVASVLVSWKAPASDGGSAIIQYQAQTWVLNTSTGHCSTTALQCTVDNLALGSTQEITVSAKNVLGFGTNASVKFLVAAAPGAPTSVAAKVAAWSGGLATVKISWAAPASNGGSPVTGYVATLSPGGKTCSANGAQLSCNVAGVTPGSSYTIHVVASNAAGSGAGADLAYTVLATAPPATPTPVSSAIGSESPTSATPPTTPTPASSVIGSESPTSATLLGSAAPASGLVASVGPGATGSQNTPGGDSFPIVLLVVAACAVVAVCGLGFRFFKR